MRRSVHWQSNQVKASNGVLIYGTRCVVKPPPFKETRLITTDIEKVTCKHCLKNLKR